MKRNRMMQGLWLLFLFSLCALAVRGRLKYTAREKASFAATPAPVIQQVVSYEGDNVRVSLIPPTPPTTETAPSRPPVTATPSPLPTPFALYWLSDTQVYSYRLPTVMRSLCEYMGEKRTEHNALAVLQTGDIVDNRHLEGHWNNVKEPIYELKEKLPFWCVAGNHDVGADKAEYETYLSYNFCSVTEPSRLYRGGECWYQTLNAGGTDFIIVGVGWQKDEDYIDWVNEKLELYSDHVGLLLVHNYLDDDGGLTPNGKIVESRIVKPNANLRLVLAGHMDGAVRVTHEYDDGKRSVTALMYNYQDDKKLGIGYMRILMFNPITRNIAVTTYSPYLDDFNYYEEPYELYDTFTLYKAF